METRLSAMKAAQKVDDRVFCCFNNSPVPDSICHMCGINLRPSWSIRI